MELPLLTSLTVSRPPNLSNQVDIQTDGLIELIMSRVPDLSMDTGSQ